MDERCIVVRGMVWRSARFGATAIAARGGDMPTGGIELRDVRVIAVGPDAHVLRFDVHNGGRHALSPLCIDVMLLDRLGNTIIASRARLLPLPRAASHEVHSPPLPPRTARFRLHGTVASTHIDDHACACISNRLRGSHHATMPSNGRNAQTW